MTLDDRRTSLPRAVLSLSRRALACAVIAAAAVPAAAAPPLTSGPFAANFVGAALIALSFPTTPFAPRKLDVVASPAIVTAKTFNAQGDFSDYKTVTAYGGAGSVVYGLTDHFAVGFTGLGFSGKGSYHIPSGNSAVTGGSYDMTTSGLIAAGSVVWDCFSGDGFRLPVLVGLNYESMHDESRNVLDGSGNSLGTLGNNLDSAGVQFGFSPQFNTGPVRWEPFVLSYLPFAHEKQTQNGTTYDDSLRSDTGGPQPGLNVLYRPWNLSFFYTLGVSKAKGTHVYSLRWAKSFGGKSAS
ncbi:MAG: hypothetical protein KGM24_05305 [Elusimicrobia bacterium]|nr:hypothetical protein [Elusimicrobiota bacterium]